MRFQEQGNSATGEVETELARRVLTNRLSTKACLFSPIRQPKNGAIVPCCHAGADLQEEKKNNYDLDRKR